MNKKQASARENSSKSLPDILQNRSQTWRRFLPRSEHDVKHRPMRFQVPQKLYVEDHLREPKKLINRSKLISNQVNKLFLQTHAMQIMESLRCFFRIYLDILLCFLDKFWHKAVDLGASSPIQVMAI